MATGWEWRVTSGHSGLPALLLLVYEPEGVSSSALPALARPALGTWGPTTGSSRWRTARGWERWAARGGGSAQGGRRGTAAPAPSPVLLTLSPGAAPHLGPPTLRL